MTALPHPTTFWPQPYALTGLITCVLAVLLGVLVLWKGPRSPAARWWTIMCFWVAGWAYWFVQSLLSSSADVAIANLRVADACSSLIPITYLHFTMHFVGRVKPRVLQLGYGVSILLALTTFTSWYASGAQWKFGMWWEVGGPGLFLSAVFFLVVPAYGILLLLRASRESQGAKKAQLSCLLVASTVGFGEGFMWFPPAFGIDIPPLGGHLIALYCIAVMYAIVRYQFFDIRVVIRRSLVYYTLVTMLTLGYFMVAFVGERYFRTTVGYQSLVLSVAVFAGMALAFQPLKLWLQRGVDRWLLPEPKAVLTRRLEVLEAELRDADKAKAIGHLAAGVSHEIKNPLSALRTFVEALPARQGDPQFLQQFQAVARRELGRLQQLAEGLVHFAQPSATEKQPLDLRQTLDELVALVGGELAQRGITLQTRYQHNGAGLMGLPGPLSQALLNLILNARDAMPHGGTLTPQTAATPPGLGVTIAGTGQG